MPDKKISQLTSATTPLAGTEVLPIVQSGATVKVSAAGLVDGRTINPSVVTQNSKSVPYSLVNNGIPFILVSSGTMGNNGALSGLTATGIGATYSNAYVYLPVNAIATGVAAGWYYAQFSSSTAATVYNNRYTSGIPTVPASPTAFATTGPGAYTQTTFSDITAISIPLAANIIGVNGSIDVVMSATMTSNANNKVVRAAFDSVATSFITANPISVGYLRVFGGVIAQGVTNRQTSNMASAVGLSNIGSSTAAAGQNTQTSIDMTTTHNLIFTVRIDTATDNIMLGNVQAVVTP